MRRLFWLAVGAGLGAWTLRKAQRKAQNVARSLTPQSLAARAGDRAVRAGGRFRRFAADVRDGMHEREAELRAAIELDGAPPEPGPGRPRRILNARYMIIDDDKDGH